MKFVSSFTRASFLFLCVFLTSCQGYTSLSGQPAFHRGLSDDSRGYSAQLSGADRSTFKVLAGGRYAKDATHVWFDGIPVNQARAETFTAVSPNYGKDDLHVFSEREMILGADPGTLELLAFNFIRDRNDIYRGPWPLHACDPNSFHSLSSKWHADSQCLYYDLKTIRNVDTKTLEVVNETYAKDSKHVYFMLGIVQGADPVTFHAANAPCIICGRDRLQCYKWGKVASCATFK